MTRLFSYCIPIDDGAAPNPYWGVCTLVICKPRIRKIANSGDWIVSTGSVDSPIGDIRNHVVYAMKVTKKLSMQTYDTWVRSNAPGKTVDWENADIRRRLGDTIYEFKGPFVRQRPSVHGVGNRDVDLGGTFALISDHFYYFGDRPILLPEHLWPIVKQGQGHRSNSNAQHLTPFLSWISSLGLAPNTLHGEPQVRLFDDGASIDVGKIRCRVEEANVEEDDDEPKVGQC